MDLIKINESALTKTAFIVPDMGIDDWGAMGQKVFCTLKEASLWWLGDWVIYGEEHFNQESSQYIEDTGYSHESIRNAAWVCKRWHPKQRVYENLTFSHYQVVVNVEAKEIAETLLNFASFRNWSVSELREEMNIRLGKEPIKRMKKCPKCGHEF